MQVKLEEKVTEVQGILDDLFGIDPLGVIKGPEVSSSVILDKAVRIVEIATALNAKDRVELVRFIGKKFQGIKFAANTNRNEQPFETLFELKTHIIAQCAQKCEYSNWKDALLGVNYPRISRTFLKPYSVVPDAQKPISLANKNRFTAVKRKNVCAISGSSFATNIKSDLENAPTQSNILDGSYSASTQDGWVMAVGDGCGHGKDSEGDEDIGRSAYFAAKQACRYMSGYPNADELKQELESIAKGISQDIKDKVEPRRGKTSPIKGDALSSTTLVCCRAFKSENEKFRIVGFNIGDTMLISYDPITKQFDTIAQARQVLGIDGGGPESLPDNYTSEKMVTFEKRLPRGSIIFGLTDGVWEGLPITENSEAEQEEKRIRDIKINFVALTTDPNFILPERINASTLTQAISHYAVCKTETRRKEGLEAAKTASGSVASLKEQLEKLQNAGKKVSDPEVKSLISDYEKALRDQKVKVGDDFTLLGLQLDQIDLNPDYTTTEKFVSGLTLGLYALIRDCLHLRDHEEITAKDIGKTMLAVLGFFATGTLAGLGYLAYKGISAASCQDEESHYQFDLKA